MSAMVACAVISGVAGVVVVSAAIGLRYLLRRREKLCDAVTVGVTASGLIIAGAVLSQNPWRSVDGYVGHSAWVQLLALASVAMLAALTVSLDHARPDERSVPFENSADFRAVRNVRESTAPPAS
jgi:arabinofuranan 3-O-arabinosyltransferase